MLILSNLFSDHAVLQQGVPLPVWGWSDKNVFVDLTLYDENGTVIAACVGRSNSDTGKFSTLFPALPAGGPYSMTAAVWGSGETCSCNDIYIGEVWLAGGQSNMEMPLAGFQLPLLYRDKLEFHAPVRMLTVPREMNCMARENVDGVWTLPEGEELEKWSAVGAYFAAALSRELNVAVGIISVNWGGTIAQTWMSEYALREAGADTEVLSASNVNLASKAHWDAVREKGLDFFGRNNPFEEIMKFHVSRNWSEIPGNKGVEQGWHLPGFDDSSWLPVVAPGTWKNQKVMEYCGVVWFRKKVDIPDEWCGRELVLKLGACDKQDVAYVNGVQIGASGKDLEEQYWNVNRVYPLPADVVSGSELTVAVRVFSFMFQGGLIGPAEEMRLELADDPSAYIPLDGEWLAGIEYSKSCAVGGLGNANTFSALHTEMLKPLAPYAVRGAIWYQGESNAETYASYRSLMNSLIADWRRLWQNPDMEFYQVLLAGFEDQWKGWPELREAQILAARDTGTGFADAVDLGDPDDIHPRDKYHVGERLAAAALHDTYKMDITGYGPEVEEAAWSCDDVKLLCRNAEGLHAENGNPGGWEIAGNDGVFHVAEVSIFGETLLLSHPDVQDPAEVRYAWHINPVNANLYNSAGLPMIPCRIRK